MNRAILHFIFIFLVVTPSIYAKTQTHSSNEYTKAQALMEQGQFQEAILLMERLSKTYPTYNLSITLGDAYATVEKPDKALNNYTQVYKRASQSNNLLFKRVALFKMARMQLWLNQNQAAIRSYSELLTMRLSPQDKNIAENGLNRSKTSLNESSNRPPPSMDKAERKLQQVRHYIEEDDGEKAYELIKADLDKKHSRTLYILAAESMALTNRPEKALIFYQQAFAASHHNYEQKEALFGIAKMQFWLGQYVKAEQTYRLLLNYKLTRREYELALAGVVKSLAYYNRPRRAYQQIPPDLIFTTPELVVAASQATSWANWADISKYNLIKYQPLTQTINPVSSLGKDLKDLTWQTNLATWPGILTPSTFYSHDSEGFDKSRSVLDYSRYWNQLAQTSIGLDYIKYLQHSFYKLDARGVYIKQVVRPTRNIILNGQIEPIEYKNATPMQRNTWNPFLWNASASYTPNDNLSLQFLTLKEVIETFPAFNDHITDNQYAGSVVLNPLPYVQFNGAYSKLDFSDNNSRNTYYIASTVTVLPDYGISATGVLRGFNDKFTSPDYFSPHQYTAANVLFKMGRKLGATWRYYVDGGFGRQYIVPQAGDPTAASPTYQWGLGITGPISKCVVLNAYYADLRQASAFLGSNDYHYQYGGISIHIML